MITYFCTSSIFESPNAVSLPISPASKWLLLPANGTMIPVHFKPRIPARYVIVTDHGFETVGEIDARGQLITARTTRPLVVPIFTNPEPPSETRNRSILSPVPLFPSLAHDPDPAFQFSLTNLLH
jgi:hypothetical protein